MQGDSQDDRLTVELDASLTDVALQPYQPYVIPFVQFGIGTGALTLQGKTIVQKGDSVKPLVTFQGGMEESDWLSKTPRRPNLFLSGTRWA